MKFKSKINNCKEVIKSKGAAIFTMVCTFTILTSKYVYADTFDNITAEISKWVIRIGGLLAFIGAVTFGMALQSEDAGGKRRGILEFTAGLIVAGFAVSYKSLFGL